MELLSNHMNNCQNYSQINDIQCDELQTIEHTKLKPLAVAVAVSKTERKILGFQVSSMPATGHLAKISRKYFCKFWPILNANPQN